MQNKRRQRAWVGVHRGVSEQMGFGEAYAGWRPGTQRERVRVRASSRARDYGGQAWRKAKRGDKSLRVCEDPQHTIHVVIMNTFTGLTRADSDFRGVKFPRTKGSPRISGPEDSYDVNSYDAKWAYALKDQGPRVDQAVPVKDRGAPPPPRMSAGQETQGHLGSSTFSSVRKAVCQPTPLRVHLCGSPTRSSFFSDGVEAMQTRSLMPSE